MKKAMLVLGACLAVAGCGAVDDESAETEISLDGKEDRLGNRFVDKFGGVLHFDDAVSYADLPSSGYKVGFTFRAATGSESKVVARISGGKAEATLRIYGPKNSRTGSYPFIGTAKVFNETSRDGAKTSVSVFYLSPRADGIYLAVVSTTRRAGGVAEASLHCGTGEGTCELGCAVIRLYDPQCGVDGVTYGNRPSAACYDVSIAHRGDCAPVDPPAPTCDDVTCSRGQHCELQEVVCVRAPCYPQPTCVDDVCVQNVFCIQGSYWDSNQCRCVSACETVRCSAGYHCESLGPTRCVPDQPTCEVGGCSSQLCYDPATGSGISTCEWRAEYACYRSATCARQGDGNCGWTKTAELTACLASPPPL